MASPDSGQSSASHLRGYIYYFAVFVSSFLITATSGNFGFDQTKGTSISGREFLFMLSKENPTTGAFIKVHNLATDRKSSVTVTSYVDSANGYHKVQYLMLSPGNATDIQVSPPSQSWEGPFVVNVTSSQNITLVAMRNGTSSLGSYTVYSTDNAGRFYDIVSFPSANENQQAEVIVIGIDEGSTGITFKSPRNFTLAGRNTDLFITRHVYDTSTNSTVFYSDGQLSKRQYIIFRSIDDLTSSTITSETDSRVIVISNSYCPNESCDSVLSEQMPPIQTLGNSYFLVPTKDYTGVNCFRVLSPWAETTVVTQSLQAMGDDTNFPPTVLAMGEYFDIDIPDGSIQDIMSIRGSNPLLLMHYLIKSDNPLIVASMTLIPSVEQFTYGNTTFSTYNTTTSNPGLAVRNFVNIITKCDLKNYVLFNRRSIPDWTPCPPLTDGGPTYCATQKELTRNGKHTLESHSKYPLTEYSAVQYGIRKDKSAFANTVFMSFPELTCNVTKDGVLVPCKYSKPTVPTPTTAFPTPVIGNMTTVFSPFPSTGEPTHGNKTANNSASHRQKAGTVLAIVIGIITLIAGTIALVIIANAACGKRSKWKRLHNQTGDNSITLDSVSV